MWKRLIVLLATAALAWVVLNPHWMPDMSMVDAESRVALLVKTSDVGLGRAWVWKSCGAIWKPDLRKMFAEALGVIIIAAGLLYVGGGHDRVREE